MSAGVQNLAAAKAAARLIRPAAGGFPYLAEVLRQAGVDRYECQLPSMRSIYFTQHGPVVEQGAPLVQGMHEVPPFDRDTFVAALRREQAGEMSYLEFAAIAWSAGVVRYVVDLGRHTCTYYGLQDESFEEIYPGVSLPQAVARTG